MNLGGVVEAAISSGARRAVVPRTALHLLEAQHVRAVREGLAQCHEGRVDVLAGGLGPVAPPVRVAGALGRVRLQVERRHRENPRPFIARRLDPAARVVLRVDGDLVLAAHAGEWRHPRRVHGVIGTGDRARRRRRRGHGRVAPGRRRRRAPEPRLGGRRGDGLGPASSAAPRIRSQWGSPLAAPARPRRPGLPRRRWAHRHGLH